LGYWLNAPFVRRALRKLNPDIVNVHYASGYGTLGRLARFKPTLLSVWGSDVYVFPYRGWINRNLLIRNLRSATRIASTSEVMARKLRAICPTVDDVFITPFGVEVDRFNVACIKQTEE